MGIKRKEKTKIGKGTGQREFVKVTKRQRMGKGRDFQVDKPSKKQYTD